MPLCIAGMHRSGTSMIARMLNLCGLYLGPEEELHAGQADNPEGFWENMRFQDINDRILEMFGGAWDSPPNFPPNWENDPRLAAIKKEASSLAAEFDQQAPWGWKDPRNSLTLPFWKQSIPDLKILVAVRHPLDVAASLSKRGYASQTFGIALWNSYMEAAEVDAPLAPTLYSHYGAFFAEPRAELERVLAFCGIQATEEQLEAACATVSGGLRHSNSTLSGLLASPADMATVRRYLDACILSGPNYEAVLREESSSVIVPKLQSLEKTLKLREKRLAGLEQEYLDRYTGIIEQQRQQSVETEAKLRERIQELRAWQTNMSGRIVEVQTLASKRAIELERLLAQLHDLKAKAELADSFANEREIIQESRWVRLAVRVGLKVKHQGKRALLASAARKVFGIKAKPASTPVAVPEPAPELQHAKVSVPEMLGLSQTPMPSGDLIAAAKKAIQFPRFALAISHDSFQAFTGGIQTVIREEMDVFLSDKISHVHFCPSAPVGKVGSVVDQGSLIVSVDGTPIGLASPSDLIPLITSLMNSEDSCASVQIHHIMNWNLDLVDSLMQAVARARKFFWIHDYYSSCESYNLLRNDRAFCGAPPITSNSCMICRYGPGRQAHLDSLSKLFEKWKFTFVTPSERSASVWKKTWPQHSDDLVVAPLYNLVATAKPNLRNDAMGRRIRIAFPGISYVQKGWLHWRKLVDVLAGDPNYELIHLGQRTGDVNPVACPETFEHIRRDSNSDQAMFDAFVKEEIDIVFYAPIWAETFSLIAYESYAAGCYTITTQESGNVAAFVEKSRSGKVFATVDVLIAYLVDVEQVRNDLAARRKDAPNLYEMVYSRSIVESTYGAGNSPGDGNIGSDRAIGP